MKLDHRRKKRLVFEHYGLSCECCDESNYGFLSIDHIDGCNKAQRKLEGSGSRLYGYLIKNNFPAGYRTLCFSCNLGRAINGGICPHKDPALLTPGRVKPFNLDDIEFGSLDADCEYLQ